MPNGNISNSSEMNKASPASQSPGVEYWAAQTCSEDTRVGFHNRARICTGCDFYWTALAHSLLSALFQGMQLIKLAVADI